MPGFVYASLGVLCVFLTLSYAHHAVFVSNLSEACLKCICAASTGCNENYPCTPEGFCGPFFISRQYWEEAGRVSLNPTYPDRNHENCARNYNCAAKLVSNYMYKFGKDCNGDGITDCEDYARIHFLGEARCSRDVQDLAFFSAFDACKPPANPKH